LAARLLPRSATESESWVVAGSYTRFSQEAFWPQLAVWHRDSLIFWIITQHGRKRGEMLRFMNDPAWEHIRFVRLSSIREIEAFGKKEVESGSRGRYFS
jgi:hypothetical protein